MNAGDLLGLSIVSAVLTSLAAISGRSLRDFSRRDLQEICQKNGQLARFSEILHGYDRVALAIEMLTVVGATVTTAAASFWLWAKYNTGETALSQSSDWQIVPDWQTVLGGGVLLGLALASVKTWVPWSLSRIFSASFVYHTWPLWRLVGNLCTPLLWIAQFIDTVLHRIVGKVADISDEDALEEEIRTIVTEGHREGLLEEDAREMIEGVMELEHADVAHVMTTRTDMHMLHVDTAWSEVLLDVIDLGHTRIPVYDQTRDDIIGVLYVKDLLPELAKNDEATRIPLRELLRKPLFVPESKPLDDLLEMFQQMRTHIAIALDEYGGVAGLVTIEDVLEEIVGEIVDEYDADLEEQIFRIDEDACEALGKTHVDIINEAMGMSLPEDGDYDTIGGFVFSELGHVPTVGESILWEDAVRVTVLEATKRRVDRVRVERESEDTRESA